MRLTVSEVPYLGNSVVLSRARAQRSVPFWYKHSEVPYFGKNGVTFSPVLEPSQYELSVLLFGVAVFPFGTSIAECSPLSRAKRSAVRRRRVAK